MRKKRYLYVCMCDQFPHIYIIPFCVQQQLCQYALSVFVAFADFCKIIAKLLNNEVQGSDALLAIARQLLEFAIKNFAVL